MTPTFRRRAARVLAAALAVAVGATTGLGVARWVAPLPPPRVSIGIPSDKVVGGAAARLPVPSSGTFALKDSESGSVAGNGADTVRPIASIAKTATALAVLDAYPLKAGQDGPTLTVTPDDVALLQQVVAADGSHVDVFTGESLSERQLLLGMMLPSANNFAVMLGRFVAGNDAAFLVRLNAMAAKLGMTQTHFADAAGIDPGTVSSASDLVILGEAAIANPALVDIMAQPQAQLPGGGQITNLDPLVGSVPGWLGIKTGHTNAAGYCLLFAARRTLSAGTPPVTVVGAILGQAQREDTFAAARAAVEADFGDFVVYAADTSLPVAEGSLTSAWTTSSSLRVTASGAPLRLLRRGSRLNFGFVPDPVDPVVRAGSRIGRVTVSVKGTSVGVFPVVAVGDLGEPSWWWRLWR